MLSNISRSKGNRAIKFGQLTEYNMRNIFLEKSLTKCAGEASSRPYLWINSLKCYTVRFYCMPKSTESLPKYIETKRLTICLYLI